MAYAVSETDIATVQKAIQEMDNPGTPLLSPRLILPGNQRYSETGQVVFVDNQVNRDTGTITVRARFDNAESLLLPGQYVTVEVRAAAPKLMPVVPQSAVLMNQDGRYVLTVKDGIATLRPIVTGPALDRVWAVESGLDAGDRVIVSGIQKVKPGQPVSVLPSDPEN